MIDNSPSAGDGERSVEVVDSMIARLRRAGRPALFEMMLSTPESARPLRDLIPALVEPQRCGSSPRECAPSLAPEPAASDGGAAGQMPERLGDYVIIRWMGGGGMGVVYEAEHASLKSRVALKVMHPRFRADPKYLRRFHAEARVAAGLHHTNIVSVFDFGDQDGVCFYAMQFIRGRPLDHVLADIRRVRGERTHAESIRGPGAVFTFPAAQGSVAHSPAAERPFTGHFAVAQARDGAVESTEPIGPSEQAVSARFATIMDPPVPAGPDATERAWAPRASPLGGSGEHHYFREIARVGAQVADAMEYAHQRGVLHRDIKPSNLLLDALGNVWVTDFGLAKLEQGDDLSHSRELVGTLRYMAPERFRRRSARRGDIYSLGATLYELLTLRPPFDDSDQIRLIERIRTDPPPPPRQLDRSIPRDLETVVLKALAKDPKDRFGSAGELADELRRFVEGRPIRSRPVSVVEQLWRWCKRDPWLAGANIAAASLTIVLAVVASVASVVYWKQAKALRTERARSDATALDARWRAVDAYTAQAQAGRFSRRPGQRFESLEAVSQAAKLIDGLPPGLDSDSRREKLRDLAIAALALPDVKPTGRMLTRPPDVIKTAHDPTMTRYALRFRDGRISVRRVVDDQEVARFAARGDREISIFRFSPDGRYLATTHFPGFALTVCDVDRAVVALNYRGRVHGYAARFSPDSRRLALLNESREVLEFDLLTGRSRLPWRVSGLGCLVYRDDGTQIALVDNESKPPSCCVLDAGTGQLLRKFSLGATANDLAWSPDGTTIATAGRDMKIYLWDADTGIQRATLEGHSNSGIVVAFHPAGTLLASHDWSAQGRLWDPILGRPWLTQSGAWPEFSGDGQIIVGNADTLSTYQVDPAQEYRTFARASRESIDYARASVHRDGRLLAVGTKRGAVIWDLAHGNELAFLEIGNSWHLTFDPSGDLITSGTKGVLRWPIRLDEARGEFSVGPARPLRLPAGQCGIGIDASGTIVAKSDKQYAYVATPDQTRRVGPLNDCRSVAVSPDGQWLATGTHIESHDAQVWRIRDLFKVAELPIGYGSGVEFSADGKWLMTAEAPCRLWEVGTWRLVRQIGGRGACFSPDGRYVVVHDPNHAIRVVEIESGRPVARLESPDACQPGFITFSPDGSRLVMTSPDGPAVHVWDLRAIRRHLAGMGLDWNAPAYSDVDPASPAARPFRRIQIKDFDHAIARGVTLAYAGRWDEAAAAYELAFTCGTSERPELWFERAILELAVGDRAGYRAIRRHMLEVFGGNNQLPWLEYAAHAFVLAADSPAEEAQALGLAERRAAIYPDAFSEHVLGSALYRSGRFGEAVARLVSNDNGNPGWRGEILDRLVAAMAMLRLGRLNEARRSLEQAESWIAARLRDRPGGPDRAVPEGWPWRDAILLHLLRREARALIGAKLPVLPENAFAPAPHGN
jgi:eukaryotic-like serine/threonine-protein kinase